MTHLQQEWWQERPRSSTCIALWPVEGQHKTLILQAIVRESVLRTYSSTRSISSSLMAGRVGKARRRLARGILDCKKRQECKHISH